MSSHALAHEPRDLGAPSVAGARPERKVARRHRFYPQPGEQALLPGPWGIHSLRDARGGADCGCGHGLPVRRAT